MTDRTQNNRLFDDVKILTLAAASLVINYAFVIGINTLDVLEVNWDLEHDTKCANFFTRSEKFWAVYLFLTISGICADIALHR